MFRTTTPTHNFDFETDPSNYSKIVVTYKQNGRVVLKKEKSDMTIAAHGTGYRASVTLTQEDTNKFDEFMPIFFQLHVLDSGTAMKSQIWRIDMDTSLDDEVI